MPVGSSSQTLDVGWNGAAGDEDAARGALSAASASRRARGPGALVCVAAALFSTLLGLAGCTREQVDEGRWWKSLRRPAPTAPAG